MIHKLELTLVTARGKMRFPISIKTDGDPFESIGNSLDQHNMLCQRYGHGQISKIHFGDAVVCIVGYVDWALTPPMKPEDETTIVNLIEYTG